MAQEYSIEIYGHPSIYRPHDSRERKLKVYFSTPENGVNSDTGILLLISGFSANANSKVYKKMRDVFADSYNLVCIQCDYFGWEFMQSCQNFSVNKAEILRLFPDTPINFSLSGIELIQHINEIAAQHKQILEWNEELIETPYNFNDMGIMQALDNISAVITVIEILKDNNYNFDENKKIIYGNSHGSYLAYLCNAFAPSFFSNIIDNSAWLFPKYLTYNRCFPLMSNIHVIFEYLASQMYFDRELLSLPILYQKFQNRCQIISFHGQSDILIPLKDKKEFLNQLPNTFLTEISSDNIDNVIFSSDSHGLSADFLKLFDFVMQNSISPLIGETLLADISYTTRDKHYFIDYSKGLPIINIRSN